LCFHGLFKQAQLCEKSALFEFSVTRRFQVQVLAQLLGPEVPVPHFRWRLQKSWKIAMEKMDDNCGSPPDFFGPPQDWNLWFPQMWKKRNI
jgi:hypothetical protein